MDKSVKLPAEAETLFPIVRDEWNRIGSATGPVDRQAAQAAMSQIYRFMGMEPPKIWIWMGSPFAGALAASMLVKARLRTVPYLGTRHGIELGHQIREFMAGRLSLLDWLRELVFAGPRKRLRDPTLTPLADRIARDLRAQIRAQAGNLLWVDVGRVWDQSSPWAIESGKPMPWPIRVQLYEQIPDAWCLSSRFATSDDSGPGDSIFGKFNDQLRRQLRYEFWPIGQGQHDWIQLAHYDLLRRAGLLYGADEIAPFLRLAETTGWWWGLTNSCILTERATAAHFNAAQKLHCADGPALHYPDGWAIYAWHGVTVPAWIIEEKRRITPERIEAEENADLRNVMLEIFGFGRYIAARGAQLIARDEVEGIPCSLYEIGLKGDRLRILHIAEDGVEADGQPRERHIRVAQKCANPQEAILWQRGLHKPLALAGHPYARRISLGHITKIIELSPEEEALVPVVIEEWLRIGRATDPADRETAQSAISDIYRRAGLQPPSLWIWLDNPFAAAMAVLLLFRERNSLPAGKQTGAWTPAMDDLEALAAPILNSIEEQVGGVGQGPVQARRRWRKLAKHVGSLQWIQTSGYAVVPSDEEPYINFRFWAPLGEDTREEVGGQVSGDAGCIVWKLRETIEQRLAHGYRRLGSTGLQAVIEHAVFDEIRRYWRRGGGRVEETACCLRNAADLAMCDLLCRIERGVRGPERLEPLFRAARSAGWWWPFEKACIVTERPVEIHSDDEGRPHNVSGPAIVYRDGWGVHAVHGRLVDHSPLVLPA